MQIQKYRTHAYKTPKTAGIQTIMLKHPTKFFFFFYLIKCFYFCPRVLSDRQEEQILKRSMFAVLLRGIAVTYLLPLVMNDRFEGIRYTYWYDRTSFMAIVHAATQRQKSRVKLAISPCHVTLTPGQPVPTLIL